MINRSPQHPSASGHKEHNHSVNDLEPPGGQQEFPLKRVKEREGTMAQNGRLALLFSVALISFAAVYVFLSSSNGASDSERTMVNTANVDLNFVPRPSQQVAPETHKIPVPTESVAAATILVTAAAPSATGKSVGGAVPSLGASASVSLGNIGGRPAALAKIDSDPFANVAIVESDPFANDVAVNAIPITSALPTLGGTNPIAANPEVAAANAKVIEAEPLIAQINGIGLLSEVGVLIPALKFDYDPSEKAKIKRQEDKLAEFLAQGMPEAPSRLRAQLAERELVSKKSRALHSRKRSIVRLIQEARLKKDADGRDSRLEMLKIKQEQVAKEMAENEQVRREAEAEKAEDRKTRDAKVKADRERVESEKNMMRQIRLEETKRQQAENDKRRLEEKVDKKNEHKSREERGLLEKESKRKMLEEFQSMMRSQMEDQKRLAAEDRLIEAQEARESRSRMEAQLGIKNTPADVQS